MVDKLDIRKIREMSDEQILDAIEDNRQQMWQLRLDKATGELRDMNQLKANQHNLARLKTAQHERLLAAKLAAKEGGKND